jgi:putative transposase
MDITVQIQLNPSETQSKALLETLTTVNQAADFCSNVAFSNQVWPRFALQKHVYYDVKEKYKLTAQMVIRVIAKVSDSYKKDKKVQRFFKPKGAVAYDSRVLSWNMKSQMVSIWVLGFGRTLIPWVAGERQLRFLRSQSGETKLQFRGGRWYLLTCCTVEEPTVTEPKDFLGVDLGVENIAMTSDGKGVASKPVEDNRVWYHRRRKALQSVGTKSAYRRLRQLAGRQARFQRDVNHRISKELVLLAKRTNRGIGLEDLAGISTKVRARGKQNRSRFTNWSFFQLRFFIEYKARGAGVRVRLVNPAYTSQRCSRCGHVEKENRKSQSDFCCCACGFQRHADVNAALNIRYLAQGGTVNYPMVLASGTSPRL